MTGLTRVEASRPCSSRAPILRLAASRNEVGECAVHRGLAAYAFGLTTQPHRRVLFDDRKQLKPNSVNLEDARKQIRREIHDLGFFTRTAATSGC